MGEVLNTLIKLSLNITHFINTTMPASLSNRVQDNNSYNLKSGVMDVRQCCDYAQEVRSACNMMVGDAQSAHH